MTEDPEMRRRISPVLDDVNRLAEFDQELSEVLDEVRELVELANQLSEEYDGDLKEVKNAVTEYKDAMMTNGYFFGEGPATDEEKAELRNEVEPKLLELLEVHHLLGEISQVTEKIMRDSDQLRQHSARVNNYVDGQELENNVNTLINLAEERAWGEDTG